MLHQVQRFDPAGVGARSLNECLQLQLDLLPEKRRGANSRGAWPTVRWNACRKIGVAGLAHELNAPPKTSNCAVHLLRSLEPRPGAQMGGLSADTYVTPDCVVWRQQGQWRVALAPAAVRASRSIAATNA